MKKFIDTLKTNVDFKMKVTRGFLFFALANAFMLFVSFKVPNSTEKEKQTQVSSDIIIDEGMNSKISKEQFTYEAYEKEMIHQKTDLNVPSLSRREKREENNSGMVKSYIEKRRAQQNRLRDRKPRTRTRRVIPKRNYQSQGTSEMWQKNSKKQEVVTKKQQEVKIPVVEKPLTKEQKIQRALNNVSNEEETSKAITVLATIDHNQIILNGGNVNMRLLEDLKIGNTIIPEDTSLYGTCAFKKNGRVEIEIFSISFKKSRIPVKLIAYDYKDAQKGLIVGSNVVQDAISEQAKKESNKEIRTNTGRLGGIITTILKKNDKTTKVQLYDEHWFYLKSK
jgi:hypothetical protein